MRYLKISAIINKYIDIFFTSIFINKKERKLLNFIKNKNIPQSSFKFRHTIVFNAFSSPRSFANIFLLSLEKNFFNYNFVAYYPFYTFYRKKNNNIISFFFIFHFSIFKNYLLNRKYKKFYSLITNNVIKLHNSNFFNEIKYWKKSKKILEKIKNPNQLKSFRYNKIYIGDIIYDTYLRFSNNYKINIDDIFLVEITSKSLFMIDTINNCLKKNNVRYYITQQSGYVSHCLPARLFSIFSKVLVFGGRVDYLREHKKNSLFFHKDFKNFSNKFKNFSDKNRKIKDAKSLLINKFSGKKIVQESYMKNSVFSKKKFDITIKPKVVIFLHDFLDSPLSFGKVLFNDFYEWTNETLNFLRKNNLNKEVFIKPHPNSIKESWKVEQDLKLKYSEFTWLKKDISNRHIFNLKPLFGLSVYGTALQEMSYYNIPSICCGDNPTMSYNFVYYPKNKVQYFKLIQLGINSKLKIKSNKRKIYEMTYCNYLYDETKFDLLIKKNKFKHYYDGYKAFSEIKRLVK